MVRAAYDTCVSSTPPAGTGGRVAPWVAVVVQGGGVAVMTKAAQETYVGAGLAVGLLATDVVEVSANRMSTDVAFTGAWRSSGLGRC